MSDSARHRVSSPLRSPGLLGSIVVSNLHRGVVVSGVSVERYFVFVLAAHAQRGDDPPMSCFAGPERDEASAGVYSRSPVRSSPFL
jgi:hypothetical protein